MVYLRIYSINSPIVAFLGDSHHASIVSTIYLVTWHFCREENIALTIEANSTERGESLTHRLIPSSPIEERPAFSSTKLPPGKCFCNRVLCVVKKT